MPEVDPVVTRFPELLERFVSLCRTVARIEDDLSEGASPDLGYSEPEADIEASATAVKLAAHARALAAFEPKRDVVVVDGVSYKRMNPLTTGHYFTRDGEVAVPRHLYRQVGVRNGPTLVPLELRAGLVSGTWTPAAALAASALIASVPSREAERLATGMRVLPYSRSSLDRVAEEVGQKCEEHRGDGHAIVISTLDLPEAAVSVSVSVDRVSVPMEEPASEETLQQPGKEDRKVEIHKRMAFVGVLTIHGKEGEPIHSLRYGRMPEYGSDMLVAWMRDDLLDLLNRYPHLGLVTLGDGAPEIQGLLDRIVEGLNVSGQGVDFWHVAEKLSAGIVAAGRKTDAFLPRFKRWLARDRNGPQRVLLLLRTWALEFAEDEVPEDLHAAITYLTNQGTRMNYPDLRAQGLPIGSGHVEATCKTLVSVRMKRCGARWKTFGGQQILNLRSIHQSHAWDVVMRYVLTTYVQEVCAA